MAIAMVAGFASGIIVRQMGWYAMWTPVVTFVATLTTALVISVGLPEDKGQTLDKT